MSKNNLTKAEKTARKKIRNYICGRRLLARQRFSAIMAVYIAVINICVAAGLMEKIIGSENTLSPVQRVTKFFIFFTIAAVLGAGAFYFFRSNAVMRRDTKRSLEAIRQRGELEKAAAELGAEDNTVFGMGSLLLSRITIVETIASENYLFARNYGAALRYDDIVRYSVTTAKGAAAASDYLKVYTSDRKAPFFFYIGTAKRSGEKTEGLGTAAERMIGIISQRNPSAVFEEQKKVTKAKGSDNE